MDEAAQPDPVTPSPGVEPVTSSIGVEAVAPPVSELQWALRELQIAMDHGAAALARRAGLSPNDMAGLDVVTTAEPGRSVGPVDIARRLDITTASATAMVDRLVAAGHLERHPHPSDRRRVLLRHTPQAEEAVWYALQPLLAGLSRVEDRFSAAERAVMLRYLREIAAVWQALDDD